MTWGELDLDKELWTLPGGRTKNDEAHEVPLSEQALAVIASLPRIKSDKGYLFTTNGKTHVSRVQPRQGSYRQGDARHCARGTGPGNRNPPLDVSRFTPNRRQRHGAVRDLTPRYREGGEPSARASFAGIVGVYQRHSFSDEKRNALEAWGKFVVSLIEGRPANVVPLRA